MNWVIDSVVSDCRGYPVLIYTTTIPKVLPRGSALQFPTCRWIGNTTLAPRNGSFLAIQTTHRSHASFGSPLIVISKMPFFSGLWEIPLPSK
jgi:hypothetical protein